MAGASLLFMYGTQRALEMVGIFGGHFLFFFFLFFNSSWVLGVFGVCDPGAEIYYGWLGNPCIGDTRRHM